MREITPGRIAALKELAGRLGHLFHDYIVLDRALTHCSYANEVAGQFSDNERYEFLGDAVLELVVTHLLCDFFPDKNEGELSKIRAASVNKKTLARLGHSLDLGQYLLLSHGEQTSNGHAKSSILADAFEAVLAAIYLDGGLPAAFNFVSGHFLDIFRNLDNSRLIVVDFKTRFQEICQSKYHEPPYYKLIEERGPDHAKEFFIEVYVNGEQYGQGQGNSKKEAEQQAAKNAMGRIESETKARHYAQ